MTSPILSRSWLTNPVIGLPYTGAFKNYGKSQTKITRLADALSYLRKNNLIASGSADTKHLVGTRQTFFKIPPCVIRADENKLAALRSINIDINEYEHIYMDSPLPTNTKLTEYTVESILSKAEYVPLIHLFNDTRIEREMEHRISNHTVQCQLVHDSGSIENNFDLVLSSSLDNNNAHSTNETLFLSADEFSASSQSHRIENSARFASLFKPNATTQKKTFIDLRNQHGDGTEFLEEELFQIEQDLLDGCFSSTIFNGKTTIERTINDNSSITTRTDSSNAFFPTNDDLQEPISNTNDTELQTTIPDENRPTSMVESVECGRSSTVNLKDIQAIDSSSLSEPTSGSVQKKSSWKRSLPQREFNSSNKKRRKDDNDEDKDERSTAPSLNYELSLTRSFSFSPIATNSTITIGDARIDEHDVNQLNSLDIDINSQQGEGNTLSPSSILNVVSMSCGGTDDVSLAVNVINSNEFETADVQSNMIDQSPSFVVTTGDKISNSSHTTNHQQNDQTSINAERKSSDALLGEQKDNAILSQIYRKLILSDSIVMSKSNICSKLKHMSTSIRMRERAINDLVNDKLLVMGDWFSLNSIKGVTNITGYLKGHPGNEVQSQMEFASTLSKYSIDFIDFEESFKKDKANALPRTLFQSDIKQSTWSYSQSLVDKILSNNFLKERILIDSSAIIQSPTTESQHHQRIRTAKQFFSPPGQK